MSAPSPTDAAAEADDFTAEERGYQAPGRRRVGRVLVIAGVAVLLVAVVLTGNLLSVGTFVPWLAAPERAAEQVDVDAEAPAWAGDDLHASAADLVAAEDARAANAGRWASIDPAGLLAAENTVYLAGSAEGVKYTLDDLLARGAVRQDDATTYTLVHDVVVGPAAALWITAPGATLRLPSSAAGFTSIVGWGGTVRLDGAPDARLTVIAWDEGAGVPDTDTTDGRAYVRVRDGALLAHHTRFEQLGFWSGRTGGLSAATTTYGWSVLELDDTEHVGLQYGLYAAGVDAGSVVDADISGSIAAGVQVTGGSEHVSIRATTIDGSGTDGILLDRDSRGLSVTGSTVTNSGGFGIRAKGTPLASGPSAGGFSTEPADGLQIVASTIRDNAHGGVWASSIGDVRVDGATIAADDTALRIDGDSARPRIVGSTLTSSEHRGLSLVDGVSGATVESSRISGPRVAFEIRDAAAALRNSSLTVDTGHVIEASDDARLDVADSTFAGTGQDAVVSFDDARTSQRGNDGSAWTFQFEFVAWMNEHPMMWMWALVLVIPAIGLPLLARRRRKHRELRALLRDAVIRYGRAQLDAYGAPAASAPAIASTAAAPVAAPAAAAAVPTLETPRVAPVSSPTAPTRPVVVAPAAPERPAPVAPARAPLAPRAPIGSRPPRSFGDLRTGALAGREFETLQQFAVAAVLEAGYPVSTIARLFRVPGWKLQTWVQETVTGVPTSAPAAPAPGPRPGVRRWVQPPR
ncbi:right-handed parallel beta-helix repeat-containing protein [Microbacterium sp. NPDC091313]